MIKRRCYYQKEVFNFFSNRKSEVFIEEGNLKKKML